MRKLHFKKLLRRKPSVQAFLDGLREKGAQIGEDVYIYDLSKTLIDATAPWLLTIGDHVRIAEGAKILTHDYAWSVLKQYSSAAADPGSVLGAQSAVEIGSSVFIGMNAIITRGVRIGDHVIIGAGSVVTKDCPSGGVYAGNPARRIMTMDEYYEKRRAAQFPEAKKLALHYEKRFGKQPPREIFAEYFMLFCRAEEAAENETFRKKMELLGNFDRSLEYMRAHEPMFDSYEEFLRACKETQQENV